MNRPAELKKARIRNRTEWTGLRAEIDHHARGHRHGRQHVEDEQLDGHGVAVRSLRARGSMRLLSGRARRPARLAAISLLPAVAVREQLLLVVEQLLARLGGELVVRAHDDGVDRAGLLAEAAIDALGHVDVVAGRAAAAVGARLALDDDALRRADRLAQLAGDAALLAVGIAAQHVLAAEARAQAGPSRRGSSASPSS